MIQTSRTIPRKKCSKADEDEDYILLFIKAYGMFEQETLRMRTIHALVPRCYGCNEILPFNRRYKARGCGSVVCIHTAIQCGCTCIECERQLVDKNCNLHWDADNMEICDCKPYRSDRSDRSDRESSDDLEDEID
jgi:hypothetical protein